MPNWPRLPSAVVDRGGKKLASCFVRHWRARGQSHERQEGAVSERYFPLTREVPEVTPPERFECMTCFRPMLPVDRGLFSTCRRCWEQQQRESAILERAALYGRCR